jgi:hypothetical protein
MSPVLAGFATWDDYRRGFGLPEEELALGEDRVVDPDAIPVAVAGGGADREA